MKNRNTSYIARSELCKKWMDKIFLKKNEKVEGDPNMQPTTLPPVKIDFRVIVANTS